MNKIDYLKNKAIAVINLLMEISIKVMLSKLLEAIFMQLKRMSVTN